MMVAAFCWMIAVGYAVVLIFVDQSISTSVLFISGIIAILLSLFIHHVFFFLPAKREEAELRARFQKFGGTTQH